MDKSYRARYQVSLIDYGRAIKVDGMEAFLAAQVAQWTCPHCGGAISLHDRVCSDCHVPTPERPSLRPDPALCLSGPNAFPEYMR